MADATPVEYEKETMTNVNGLPQVVRKPKVTAHDQVVTVEGKRKTITFTRQKN